MRVADPPTFVLLPHRLNFGIGAALHQIADFALYDIPFPCPEERALFQAYPPVDLGEHIYPPKYTEVERLEVERQRFTKEERIHSRERRRRARARTRGRRGARRIPLRWRWEISLFAPRETPPPIRQHAVARVVDAGLMPTQVHFR